MSLAESLVDDLAGIEYNPDTYVAPAGPKPLAKGTYRARLTKWVADTDRSTGALRTPYTAVINLEITEGPAAGRFVNFQRISSRTFGNRSSSMLVDLIAILAKATNTEGAVKGREAVEHLLDLARDTNASFSIRTDLEAYDKEFINGIKAEGNVPTNEDYATARISGARNFNENGTVVGPSGNELSAQAVVKGFGA